MKDTHDSSAYDLVSQYLTDRGRSLIYMRESKGPKIDPCRTPHTSSAGSDKVELTSTMKLPFARYDLNQAIVGGEQFKNTILSRIISYHS